MIAYIIEKSKIYQGKIKNQISNILSYLQNSKIVLQMWQIS